MLLYTVLFLLLSNAVTQRRDKSILYSRVLIVTLICCLILCINCLHINFIGKGIGLFGGLYHSTIITNSFHAFVILLTILMLQLNGFYPRKIWTKDFSSLLNLLFYKLIYFNTYILNKMAGQYKLIEYPLIILFILIGGIFLISSSDLISIFLSIELQSYGLYILCTVYRNSERATSGGLTYFLLGGLSSCFILLASGLLYGNSGNTSFDGIYIINNISSNNMYTDIDWYNSSYLNLSLIIMSVGFLFKISAAPFHFWSPDVYDSVPTIVTTFIAIFAKVPILILLLELVHYTTNFFSTDNFSWTITLLISSLLSLIIGSVLGLTQFRIKRLYAYSTISHIGFILLALAINSVESIQSFLFYLMQYSLSNLNVFMLTIIIGFSLYSYVEENSINKKSSTYIGIYDKILDKNNSPVQLISQIKGYFYINPFLSLSLAITLFSFVGIPPLIGFFAKQMILSSALDNGYIFITFIAILTSVISAYYYLAIVKQMFFYKSNYTLNPVLVNTTMYGNIISKKNNEFKERIILYSENIKLGSSLTITVSVLTLIMLLFVLMPEEWLNMTNILALILFNS